MINPRILAAITITLVLLAIRLNELTPSLTLIILSLIVIIIFLISKMVKNKTILFDITILAILVIISLNLLDVPSTIAIILMYIAILTMETAKGPTTSRPIEASILLTTALILLKYSKRQILIIVTLLVLPYITNIIRRETEDNGDENKVRSTVDLISKLSSAFRD